MKVLLTADIHMNLSQLDWVNSQAERFDLVVIAGDLLQLAYTDEKPKQIDDIIPRLQAIRQKCPLIVSSGNHDGNSSLGSGEEYANWISELDAFNIVSDGQTVDIQNYRFTCCPWWNGPELRNKMVTQIQADSNLQDKKWVWIHHAPPRGSRIAWTTKGDVGDPFLLRLIGRYKPALVLCGHVHNAPFYPEGGWAELISNTWVFNPGKQPGDIPATIEMDLDFQYAERHSFEGLDTLELAPAN